MVKVNYRLDIFLWFDCFIGFFPRVGIIIECPLNGLFHDLMNIIITSQVAISEMVDRLDNTNRSYSFALLTCMLQQYETMHFTFAPHCS